uniref:Small integral membrane protein 26 n=1 Tax=Takifugu rubripes TaxID=31033 RepID=A0A3B5K1C0_TAKRU
MSLNDVSKWHKRMSVVYAFGVWSMIASYAFFKYTGRYDDAPVVYKTPHSKTVIIYKKDFVPYTTRIYNFIKSFSGEPGTGDK